MNLISFEKPSLKLGNYQIKVTQNVKIKSKSINQDFISTQKIAIVGDRFNLNPHNIHMVYPAENSIYNFSYVLPHIIMNNEFYPWERKTSISDRDAPYVALLLFHENEDFSSKTITLDALKSKIHLTDSQLEVSDNKKDKINVIEVEKELLKKIMPTSKELQLLTHVQETNRKRSVIISNRLPFKGGGTTACLVSLENRFHDGSFNFASEGESISLVLLKKWNFVDIKFYSTQKIAEHSPDISEDIRSELRKDTRTYRGKAKFSEVIEKVLNTLKPNNLSTIKEAVFTQSIDDSPVFTRLLTKLSVKAMCMPYQEESPVNVFLKKAMVPLFHHLRTGDKTVSWYRGVLVSGERKNNLPTVKFPINFADELLFFDKEYQMFDISYAAAWELGKLLCLKNIDIASELLIIKKKQALNSLQKENLQENDLLPIQIDKHEINFSNTLVSWFDDLKKLENIPLNYLLADEQLLEEESLRFFVLDEFWLKCLIEGALELGGEISSSYRNTFDELRKTKTHSGIVLRSEIQLIWPDLEIIANKKAPIKVHRLTADTLLYLFEGIIDSVEIKQAPQALHFEVDSKTPYKDGSQRVVDIARLGGDKDSAYFAEKCMATPKGVRFLKGL